MFCSQVKRQARATQVMNEGGEVETLVERRADHHAFQQVVHAANCLGEGGGEEGGKGGRVEKADGMLQLEVEFGEEVFFG
jgi:hypothetical protein